MGTLISIGSSQVASQIKNIKRWSTFGQTFVRVLLHQAPLRAPFNAAKTRPKNGRSVRFFSDKPSIFTPFYFVNTSRFHRCLRLPL